ncbi:MAG TPA: glutaredoxin [Flavobacteriaceae bacterium]|nr:glutaredoxin [Flavobacteriaceae bacterium]HPF11628.1 glutaredoxin [Flavobacteriaceae bacterium]HQU20103.1 glutaredoxin [Flavobacteriaceae bacterium]HQU64808.1 glutaredoxin [Flavobacteriaceae bacterium]HRW43470.1 glutaredoxin [Flavobacteriaceae bacterium]
MKQQVILFIALLSLCMTNAQQEQVLISEKKTGKRLVLMAENTTADTLNVFLMVFAEGYRRSADKPILKDIPPFSKVPMTTLIELSGIPSSYTYDLIVNENRDNSVSVTYEKQVVDIENVLKGKIVIFSISNCEKCEVLVALLESERVNFRNFNLDEDPSLYRQFMNFINNELKENTQIRFPVIWNKTYTIFGYDELEKVAGELNN